MRDWFKDCSSLTTLTGVEDFNVALVTNMTDFLFGVTLPTAQYSELLVNYEAQAVQNNVAFHGGNSQYSAGAAATAHANLIADHTWTITDGGPV
jgi:surface protein